MSTKLTELVTYNNPFRAGYVTSENEPACLDPILKIADKVTEEIVDFGARYKLTNFERQVDFAATATKFADNTVFSAIAGLQIGMIANQFLHLGLEKVPYIWVVPAILKIVAAPLSFFFIGVGLVEGFVELVQIRRVVEVLHVVRKGKSPIEKLNWFKHHYFSLSKGEEKHITLYVDQWIPEAKKAKRYDKIAKKILTIKYEKLERRVTPDLAKAIKEQLALGTQELSNKTTVETGVTRLNTLFESIEKQAKIILVSRALTLIAITVGLIGTIAATAGFGGIPVAIAVAIIVITLVASKLLLDYGVIRRAAINLHNRLEQLNLLSKETLAPLLDFSKALE